MNMSTQEAFVGPHCNVPLADERSSVRIMKYVELSLFRQPNDSYTNNQCQKKQGKVHGHCVISCQVILTIIIAFLLQCIAIAGLFTHAG